MATDRDQPRLQLGSIPGRKDEDLMEISKGGGLEFFGGGRLGKVGAGRLGKAGAGRMGKTYGPLLVKRIIGPGCGKKSEKINLGGGRCRRLP